MNPIQETLEDLRHVSGVKGCMVVTHDGLVVADSLGPRYRQDIVAGLSSYLAMTTNRALAEGGLGKFDSFVLHAAHGKSVFHDIGEAVLVVLMDQFADLEQGRHELQSAVQRLRRSARLG
ncbi:MAG: hypothetical protein RLZZ562_753 [Planctomycetota bacterium]